MAVLKNKTKENPRITERKISGGRISLFLEYNFGRTVVFDKKTKTKKRKQIRREESLGLYLTTNPQNKEERAKNNEIIAAAKAIREERSRELLNLKHGNKFQKKNVGILSCMDSIKEWEPKCLVWGFRCFCERVNLFSELIGHRNFGSTNMMFFGQSLDYIPSFSPNFFFG